MPSCYIIWTYYLHRSTYIIYLKQVLFLKGFVSSNLNSIFSIGVRPAIPEMWGQIVRYYYPMLLSFMISVTMMVFAQQLKLVGEPDKTRYHVLSFLCSVKLSHFLSNSTLLQVYFTALILSTGLGGL